MRGVKVYGPSGVPTHAAVGIFARLFMDRFPFVPGEDDGRLHDPALRENFIERIFVFKRRTEMKQSGGMIRDLISFHSEHKLLILAHSPKHYTLLGRLVADAKKWEGSRSLRNISRFSWMDLSSLLPPGRIRMYCSILPGTSRSNFHRKK
jgi:hypothetical protein